VAPAKTALEQRSVGKKRGTRQFLPVGRNRKACPRSAKDEAALKTRPLLGFMLLWIYFEPLRFESLVFPGVEAASFLADLVVQSVESKGQKR